MTRSQKCECFACSSKSTKWKSEQKNLVQQPQINWAPSHTSYISSYTFELSAIPNKQKILSRIITVHGQIKNRLTLDGKWKKRSRWNEMQRFTTQWNGKWEQNHTKWICCTFSPTTNQNWKLYCNRLKSMCVCVLVRANLPRIRIKSKINWRNWSHS